MLNKLIDGLKKALKNGRNHGIGARRAGIDRRLPFTQGLFQLERLASKILLTTSIELTDGMLSIVDVGESSDQIQIRYHAGSYLISDGGGLTINTSITGATGSGSDLVTLPSAAVRGIVIDLKGGHDFTSVFSVQPGLPDGFRINAGDGSHRVMIGASIDASGGPGDVTILTSGGLIIDDNASIRTGAGNIHLMEQKSSSEESDDGNSNSNRRTEIRGTLRSGGDQPGSIVVTGDEVQISGTIDATGSAGGRVEVTGRQIELAGALLDASGESGGGTILVGGDFQGNNPAIRNADETSIDAASILRADAIQTGNGGTVIVWADRHTDYFGQISARGGNLGGDGGFVEVSGKDTLNFNGLANTSAPHGTYGQVLLDPTNFTIDATNLNNIRNAMSFSEIFSISTNTSGPDAGDIFVNVPLIWNQSIGGNLRLIALRHIRVNADLISHGSSSITLLAGWDGITDTLSLTVPQVVASTSVWGNNGGSVFIGDGNQTSGIAVGSRNGATTVLGYDLTLTGSSASFSANSYAQLGYYSQQTGTHSGSIQVNLRNSLTALAGAAVASGSYAQVGHGGIDGLGNYQGAIDVTLGGNLILTGQNLTDRYVLLGHGNQPGSSLASATRSGDITLRVGGNVAANTAFLGHLLHADGSTHSGVLTVQANGNIVASNSRFNTRSGNLTLNSDRDASGAGNIQLTSTEIQTQEGAIILGGGTAPSTVAAVGSGTDSDAEKAGISLSGTTLKSTSGAISLRGQGIAGTSRARGVLLDKDIDDRGSLLQSSSGQITLHGTGGNGTNENRGVSLQGTEVSSNDGDILVFGQAGSGTSTAGVLLDFGTVIRSTGDRNAATSANAVVLATPGRFVNGAGGSAVSTIAGRWLVYSASPTTNTFDGLTSGNQALYSRTFANDPPTSITATGNRYVFTDSPSLTVTAMLTDSKTYGQTNSFPDAVLGTNYQLDGFVDASAFGSVFTQDTAANIGLTGTPTFSSTGAAATAGVGGSPYTVEIAAGTLSNTAGYALGSFVAGGGLTVNAKALTITANNRSKTYGNLLTFAGTEFSTSGLANSDTVGGADIASSGAVNTANVAGSPYAITIGNATGTGLSNYTITYANGALTVTPRDITVTALGGSSAYGENPSNPGLSATNLASFDDVTALTGLSNSFGINRSTSAGNHTLNVAGTLTNGNYNVTAKNTGTWNVTPKALSITANNQSKIYGDLLTFAGTEFSTSGLINSDTVTLADIASDGAVATAGFAGSPYAITIGNATGTGLSNYTITYVDGELTVTAVAKTPSVTNASTNEDVQTTSGLVISRNVADGAEVTHFKITSITGGALFHNDGTTAIVDGEFITFAQGNAGLKFTPTLNSFATGHFTVQASTSNGDGGLGGSTVTADITVTPVADTPSVTNATTFANTQSTSGQVISRSVLDGAEVTHFKITGITNGTLFLNDGVTSVSDGDFITVDQGAAGLRFTPSTGFVGTGQFTIQAAISDADAGLGGSTVVAEITVNANLRAVLDAGNLTITDVAGKDNNLSFSVRGTDIVITEAANPFESVPFGTLSDEGRTLTIPLTEVTGTITFQTGSGDDSLTIDFSFDAITQNLIFDSGTHGLVGNSLIVTGGTFTSVAYNATAPGAGNLNLGTTIVSFTGVESAGLAGSTMTDLVMNIDPLNSIAGTVTTTVTESTLATATLISFSSGLSNLLFRELTGGLTLNGDDADNDVISILGFGSSFSGSLTLNGRGGDDILTVDSSITRAVVLNGGAGNDSLIGGSGHDTLNGGPGSDLLAGGLGDDEYLFEATAA